MRHRVHKRLFFLALLTGLALRAFPLAAQDEQSAPRLEDPPAQEESISTDEPIRVDVNLVTLRFTVKDGSGRFVRSLGRDDLEVYENGERQTLTFFDGPEGASPGGAKPLWLAFLLDVSGSTFATRAEEILAATAFFQNIQEFTQVGIFGFTDSLLVFQDFTSDRRTALNALASAKPHLGRTAIYDSVDRLMGRLDQRGGPGQKKVIIVVSDGMDDNYRRAADSIARAEASDVTLYTIWVPSAAQLYIGPAASDVGKDERSRERRVKEEAFASLSRQTGGRHFGGFETILNFDNVLADINDEVFGNLYSVGYYTENPYLAKSERRIEVRLTNPDHQVAGLFKSVPDWIEAKRRYIAALFDNEALGDLPLGHERFREIGADIDLLRPRTEGQQMSQPFRLKISSFSLNRNEHGDVRTQFGLIGLLTDLEGNEVVRLREIFRAQLDEDDMKEGRGIIYNNRLLAPPGRYLLKVALLEIPTWRMTVLERTVRIRGE